MSTIRINNVSYSGRSIVINDHQVIIDGKNVTAEGKTINISVEGNLDSLSVDYATKIEINGTVNTVRTTSGDVNCGDVTGSVSSTSGDIECGNVGGNVNSTSGDVSAGTVSGSVSTLSGDIKHRKN